MIFAGLHKELMLRSRFSTQNALFRRLQITSMNRFDFNHNDTSLEEIFSLKYYLKCDLNLFNQSNAKKYVLTVLIHLIQY